MGIIHVAFPVTNFVAVHFMFLSFFGLACLAHLPIFHDVFIAHSYDAESTLTSIQDDGQLIFTNDVN